MNITTEMACFVGRILGCIAFGMWVAKRDDASETLAHAQGYVSGFNNGMAARAGLENKEEVK